MSNKAKAEAKRRRLVRRVKGAGVWVNRSNDKK